MWNLVFVLFAAAVALLVVHAMRQLSASTPSAAPRPRAGVRAPAANPRPARNAPPLAWVNPVDVPPALGGEQLRDRLRDRYIAARFPGMLGGAAGLARSEEVIRVARLCFEEEREDQAQELLTLAIRRAPENEALRLAQIEIAFLGRRRGRFIALSRDFRRALPQSRNWIEIARLGRAIAPQEALFEAAPGSHPHAHFGPWPDLPNWIQASWDLTAEVLAADFRRGILAGHTQPRAPEGRIAIGA